MVLALPTSLSGRIRLAATRGALAAGILAGFAPPTGLHAAEPLPKRVYHAVALSGAAPAIDGKLDDACWQQGEWAGEYRQREPFEGATPSLPTELKILYDHRNVYVAIRAHDPEITQQPRLLGQRDEFSGDMVGVAFDSYLTRRTSFEFDVTSGGSKIDLVLRNDGSVDTSWDAIWDVKVAVTPEGWSAEYRIPLSQLRYSKAGEQVWGLHSWRWIRRKQEESNWQLIPMDNGGVVHAFGELRGIRNLPPSRRIELLPYLVAKSESLAKEVGNPYRAKDETSLEAGLDAKLGLGSDFTLDLTLNPDFGQVEADPSEINLSTVETFFPEKRPFFIEGKAMFDYGIDSDLPFYSRRIGDGPSLATDDLPGYVKMPARNPILSAEKITGRTAGGFSLGLLHALTGRTEARITELGSGERRVVAEPRANYVVVRGQNDFAGGDTIVGGIFTATIRDGSDEELALLARQAVTAGADVTHYWNQRTYFVEARALATQLEGSPAALAELQQNLVHNYQRPDAAHIEFDPEAQELTGHAGRVRAGKSSNGHWRYNGGVSWRSPGVDFNDLGYLATADFAEYAAQLQYYSAEPGRWLRRRDVRLRPSITKNFDGETLEHELTLTTEWAGMRGWYVWAETEVEAARLDTRVLRGGPALRRPNRFPFWIYAESDGARKTQFKMSAGGAKLAGEGSSYYEFEPGIVRRFGDRVRADVKIGFSESRQERQYAGQTDTPAGTRYVMGRMDQKSLWAQLRLQANFSPTLSLTYFAGPYASTGRFDRFSVVARPRAADNDDRFEWLDTTRADADGYTARWRTETFRFDDPDFDWRELNSNLVLKWEFRPGSTLYAVWSQHRGDDRDLGTFTYADEYRRLLETHPDNTFLVKMSYWFSI
ncbi:DUF5916 domain-containing protein [Opitutus terrae]|uniref:Secreted protein n=1 Tax=Opitutus terrae (strain DSM 11246 / JCM 15787 / PB90-1) TaxID=452637 RepID=B1ZS96_OPITP|nr:DUF5916 domain-containing protein [Opitutus terrae]ACB75695.1 secreted protein [Opitutus terrae PB90-1]